MKRREHILCPSTGFYPIGILSVLSVSGGASGSGLPLSMVAKRFNDSLDDDDNCRASLRGEMQINHIPFNESPMRV
jgi:hypothetical protein